MTTRHRLATRCESPERWTRAQRHDLDLAEQSSGLWLRALASLFTFLPETQGFSVRGAKVFARAWWRTGRKSVLRVLFVGLARQKARYTTKVKESRQVQPAFVERAAVHACSERKGKRIIEIYGTGR
jgi:hypothetical protein